MSRSRRKAFYTISKKITQRAHRAVRRKVREVLRRVDVDEVGPSDIEIIESDTRELGFEEYGTRLGLEFDCEDDDNEDIEAREVARRK